MAAKKNKEPVLKTKKKQKRPNNLPGPGPGRPKGLKNKLPRDLKLKILAITDSLEEQGKGLEDMAVEEPKWFYENFVKPILPKDVKVDSDMNLIVKIMRFSDAGNDTAS